MWSGVAEDVRSQAYGQHWRRLLSADLPQAAFAVGALTLVYELVDLIASPAVFRAELLPNLLQPLVPLAVLFLAKRWPRPDPAVVVLVADALYSAVLAGRLFFPTTTASGTALFLALKMVATAVLFPWPIRFQFASVSATLLVYAGATVGSGRSLAAIHQLWGPLIAAALSLLGASRADRTRRVLFRRSGRLAGSLRRLRALLRTERTLGAVAREISAVTELHTLLEKINQRTAAALACDFSAMFLLDEEKDELYPASLHATSQEVADRLTGFRTPLDTPLVRELLAGRTLVINDPERQDWVPRAELKEHSIRHLAFTPIAAKGHVAGVLTVGRSTRPAPFDERQVALLRGVAAQAAVAIENARLFQRLAASEARYRDLFERANDLIVVVDEQGHFQFANQAALDFVAATTAELPSLRLQQFLSAESQADIERRARIARRRRLRSGRTFEVVVAPRPGVSATLEVRARLLGEPEAPSRVYQCIARDVSERKRQERDTQRLLCELREANRLQSEFVANVSHELRTPLNVIIGYTDLLSDDPNLPLGSEARTFLGRIAGAARGLHRMVESVLEYARLDRGHSTVVATRFTADQLVLELRGLCNDVQSSPTVTVDFEVGDSLDFSTDYDRLYSALSNLLLNALKFTPRGQVWLTVRGAGREAEFVVRDTGIGIPPDELSHVFEPFRQVDGSTRRSFGGVGLGLAIVQRNVELLGGTVAVESQINVGTTFTVRVPLALDAESAAAATSSAA